MSGQPQEPGSTAPAHRIWDVGQVHRYLAGLDRLFDSVTAASKRSAPLLGRGRRTGPAPRPAGSAGGRRGDRARPPPTPHRLSSHGCRRPDRAPVPHRGRSDHRVVARDRHRVSRAPLSGRRPTVNDSPVPGLHVVRQSGDGSVPPVVLVHGGMDRSTSFGRVARQLSDVPLTRYDRRGYGRSSAGSAPSLADHVDDLIEVIGDTP